MYCNELFCIVGIVGILLHCFEFYCIELFCIVLHCTVLYCFEGIVLHCIL